ncbi:MULTISPECIES: hypothetical protein [unclassified Arthrobacter]|uniref:hypothetical protein n=1 Tax=unclassified Arthrobacter TaxID=235627 RepID=UPI001C8423F4|nr:hypothetical protein [Arthrobacter sp. MAHUQ-56]MBX7445720.1 hypothetical protein [Arthrobacter sp. MAHUQ-56]
MFTRGTTIIGTLLALGAAAIAAPAYAASSDGADVDRLDECQTYENYQVCRTGMVVSNIVQTPAGMDSTSSSSNYVDSYVDGQTAGSTIGTQTHSHILVQNGELIEVGQHYTESSPASPDGNGQCTDREDNHQVRDSLQYDLEVYFCK